MIGRAVRGLMKLFRVAEMPVNGGSSRVGVSDLSGDEKEIKSVEELLGNCWEAGVERGSC